MISDERIKEMERKFSEKDYEQYRIHLCYELQNRIDQLLAEREQLLKIAKNAIDVCICGMDDYDGLYGPCSKRCVAYRKALKEWKKND